MEIMDFREPAYCFYRLYAKGTAEQRDPSRTFWFTDVPIALARARLYETRDEKMHMLRSAKKEKPASLRLEGECQRDKRAEDSCISEYALE